MITIYSIKPWFQKVLQPLMRGLVGIGATPNQVTAFTLLFSVCWGIYFSWAGVGSWIFMPLVLLVRMALNALDGMMARQLRMESRLGVYLNELGDMVSDLFLFLPFILIFPWLAGTAAALSLLSEAAGILGAVAGKGRRYDGPMGKSDRAFCLGVLGFIMSFNFAGTHLVNGIFAGMSLLLLQTIYFRIRRA